MTYMQGTQPLALTKNSLVHDWFIRWESEREMVKDYVPLQQEIVTEDGRIHTLEQPYGLRVRNLWKAVKWDWQLAGSGPRVRQKSHLPLTLHLHKSFGSNFNLGSPIVSPFTVCKWSKKLQYLGWKNISQKVLAQTPTTLPAFWTQARPKLPRESTND